MYGTRAGALRSRAVPTQLLFSGRLRGGAGTHGTRAGACVRRRLAARAAGTARSVSASDSTRDAITWDARGASGSPAARVSGEWGGTRAVRATVSPRRRRRGRRPGDDPVGPGGFVASGAPIDVSGGAGGCDGGVGTPGGAGVLDIAFVPELASVPEPASLVSWAPPSSACSASGFLRRNHGVYSNLARPLMAGSGVGARSGTDLDLRGPNPPGAADTFAAKRGRRSPPIYILQPCDHTWPPGYSYGVW